jgi:hypothetical protein
MTINDGNLLLIIKIKYLLMNRYGDSLSLFLSLSLSIYLFYVLYKISLLLGFSFL